MFVNLIILILIVNTVICIFYNKISKFINLYDIPNEKRKIHKAKVPLLSFIFLLTNIFVFILYLFFERGLFDLYKIFYFQTNRQFFLFLTTILALTLIGMFDDKYKLSAYRKTILIISAIGFNIYVDTGLQLNVINSLVFDYEFKIYKSSIILSTFCFFAIINTMNMLDGINTLAIVHFILIFFYFLILKLFPEIALIILITLFFLLYLNIKNKIFLGDAGIYILSYLISYIFIKSNKFIYEFKAEEILLLFFIPALDMSRVVIYRIVNNLNPLMPDNNHLHHRLIKKYNFKKSILIIYSLLFFQLIASLYLLNYFIFCILGLLCIYIYLIFHENKKKF